MIGAILMNGAVNAVEESLTFRPSTRYLRNESRIRQLHQRRQQGFCMLNEEEIDRLMNQNRSEYLAYMENRNRQMRRIWHNMLTHQVDKQKPHTEPDAYACWWNPEA